jgi:hypothetical protein
MDISSAVVVVDGQVWQKDLPDLGDLEVLVAPWDNAAFERAMTKGIRALPAAQRADGNIEPSAYYRVVGEAISRTILFGWKNFKETAQGEDKPFDPAYAKPYLINPKYKPFRDGVIAAAKRVQLGIKAEETALVGNLQTSSPGSENGEVKSSV